MMFGRGLKELFQQPTYTTPGINPDANPPMFPQIPGGWGQVNQGADQFQMPKLGTLDKLGLVGDILTQNPVTQRRLQPQQEMALAQWQYQRQRGDKLADFNMQRQAENERWVNQQLWKQQHPEPRYFEANNGDQYMIGPDGKPQKVFEDPTPKVQMMAVDNGDGTKTIIPFVNGQPMGQGAPSSAPARPSIGQEMPDPRRAGGAGSGPRTFP